MPGSVGRMDSAELREVLMPTAEDVTLSVSYPPQMQVEVLGTYPVVTDAVGTTCSVGPMLGGASRQIVFKTTSPSGMPGAALEFNIHASWKAPGNNAVLRTDALGIALTYAPADMNTGQERDMSVSQDVATIWHAFLVQQVASMNEEGRLAEARDFPSGLKVTLQIDSAWPCSVSSSRPD